MSAPGTRLSRRPALALPLLVALLVGAGGSAAEDAACAAATTTESPAHVATPSRAACATGDVRLLAVGDVQLGRRLWIEMVERDDYGLPFARTAGALAAADIAVGNLEAQLFPRCPPLDQGMRLCAGPRAVEGLADAGFDVLAVANNHSHNFGQRALDASVALLEERGIAVAGYGAIPVIERAGTRFAFVAWSPVDRYVNLGRIKRQLGRARARADVVVALVHWGIEYQRTPAVDQRELAGYVAAQGADLIVGAHPHVVQPLERVGATPVAYSLGNFVFDSWMPDETKLGAVGEFTFCGRQLRSAELLPVIIDDPGVPRFVAPGEVAGWPPGREGRGASPVRGCGPPG